MLYFSQITPICSWLLQVDVTAVLQVGQRQNGAAEENTLNSAICWLNKCGAAIPEPWAVTQTTVDSEELINLTRVFRNLNKEQRSVH